MSTVDSIRRRRGNKPRASRCRSPGRRRLALARGPPARPRPGSRPRTGRRRSPRPGRASTIRRPARRRTWSGPRPGSRGRASPGLRVTLDGSGSSGGRIWYRWLQTQGPRVVDRRPDPARGPLHRPGRRLDPRVRPGRRQRLGGRRPGGHGSTSTTPTATPTTRPSRPTPGTTSRPGSAARSSSTASGASRGARSGSAGSRPAARRSRSRPATGRPPRSSPSRPGTYQFALVVATTGGAISEPSTVTVTVGGAVAGLGRRRRRWRSTSWPGSRSPRSRAGPGYADDLSQAFDTVADGIDSCRTFAEAIAETTRRLDAVVPRDKDRRAVWIEQLFAPLMAKFAAGMKDDGLDLTQPGAQAKPLTAAQKARLAEQFRYTAAGLRAPEGDPLIGPASGLPSRIRTSMSGFSDPTLDREDPTLDRRPRIPRGRPDPDRRRDRPDGGSGPRRPSGWNWSSATGPMPRPCRWSAEARGFFGITTARPARRALATPIASTAATPCPTLLARWQPDGVAAPSAVFPERVRLGRGGLAGDRSGRPGHLRAARRHLHARGDLRRGHPPARRA